MGIWLKLVEVRETMRGWGINGAGSNESFEQSHDTGQSQRRGPEASKVQDSARKAILGSCESNAITDGTSQLGFPSALGDRSINQLRENHTNEQT